MIPHRYRETTPVIRKHLSIIGFTKKGLNQYLSYEESSNSS